MFNIDGNEWNIACKIKREAEITQSDISGLLLNKTYFNDVIGTFMKYVITVEVPVWAESRYDDLYEILTAPVGWHTFVGPYNDGEITITGRIQTVSDVYVGKIGNRRRWRNTTFTVIANHPSKTMDLNDVITTGMSPLPEAPDATVGDLYEKTSYGWSQRVYGDADDTYY